MQARIIARAAFMLMLTAPFAAHAALLGTRPGAWKDTTTISVSSGDKLVRKPETQTSIVCHDKTGSVEAVLELLGKNGCQAKIVQQSANGVVFDQVCAHPADGDGVHTRMEMKALSATHIAGTVDQSYASGFKAHLVSDAHWVSATCPNK